MVPGQDGTIRIDAGVDEIDEAFVYSNGQYILSKGVQGAAAQEIIAPVQQAARFISDALADGRLIPADFGRAEGQAGGAAALTAEGQARAAELLGAPMSGELLRRVNMAATAHFEYVENVHYVMHDGKVFIIDQTTHEVLYNPETATESRWNGGLAQAVEAKHGLTIRDDPGTSKSVTARELYARDVYGRVTGASGTALGKGEKFAAQGLSSQIADIPRYYSSRLATGADHVSPDQGAKLDAIAGDVAAMRATGTRQPQLILAHRNDLVAELSAKLTGLGVDHTAVGAKWFLTQGTSREEAFKRVIENAGKPGQVLVINMQGARGVDIPLSDDAKTLGGLHVRVTARSGMSRDIDIQAENRAARSGDAGSVSYYISPHDDAFALSRNPHVQLAVIQYTQAQTTQAVTRAETVLRNLVPLTQAEAARRMGMHTPTHQPNAPPVPATVTATATATTSDARPPDRPPAGQLAIATQTGHYLPGSGPHEEAEPQALQAALSVHPVENATVLHVHTDPATGGFLVAGQLLGPDELHEGVLAGLGLVPGQALILVACGSGAVPTGAAARLAVLAGAPVVAPTTTAVTTPSGAVLAAETGLDSAGLPVVRPGNWAVFGSDGVRLAVLPADLTSSLRHGGASQYLPGVRLAPGAAGRPPERIITWNAAVNDAQAATLNARGYAVPAGASAAKGFYQALIEAAGSSLRGVDGAVTPERIHQMVVDELANDMLRPESRYGHLMAGIGSGMMRMPDGYTEHVRDDLRLLLPWPGALAAPSAEAQQELDAALAQLESLERVDAVVEAAEPLWNKLHLEYLLALEQALPGRDADALEVDGLAAFDAAVARALGELAGAIEAARSAAPDEPVADGIRAALDAVREEPNEAAVLAEDAGQDPARAFQASVEESLASKEMTDRILDLAGARLSLERAVNSAQVLGEALIVAAKAATAAQKSRDSHLEAERDAIEWRIRRRAALEEVDAAAHDRELPPGFGVSFNRVRRFPFGHQGRMVRLGDVPLTDPAGIARLAASALPPAFAADARLAARVEAGIRAFLHDRGRHVFTQRLLEGGVIVGLGDGQEFEVTLDLDLNQVHHLRAVETELTPVGQKRHHAVEADQQTQAGWRLEIENERNLTVTANALTTFGAPLRHPLIPIEAVAGGSLAGTSSAQYVQGYDIVSATKRAPRFDGESAYFEFRGGVAARPTGSWRPPGTAAQGRGRPARGTGRAPPGAAKASTRSTAGSAPPPPSPPGTRPAASPAPSACSVRHPTSPRRAARRSPADPGLRCPGRPAAAAATPHVPDWSRIPCLCPGARRCRRPAGYRVRPPVRRRGATPRSPRAPPRQNSASRARRRCPPRPEGRPSGRTGTGTPRCSAPRSPRGGDHRPVPRAPEAGRRLRRTRQTAKPGPDRPPVIPAAPAAAAATPGAPARPRGHGRERAVTHRRK
jgi:hypothetical protein